MPDDHIDQEIDIDEDALLGSMGIIVPRHRIVNVESEVEKKGPAGGSKIDRCKKATAVKYERIAKRAKEIWQQHGFRPGENERDWHDVLSGIMSIITPLPDIEKVRSKVKRIGPAERSKVNQSETETTPELTYELIDEHEEEICQQHDCEPDEDQQNRTEAEDSNVNQSETESTPELTHELVPDPAKELWEQSECESREYEQNLIETEGLDVNKNETTPELTEELIDEQAEEIYQQHEYEPGEDEQNRTEAEGSDVNKNETPPELTYELIAERAKQIWQQNGCRPGEDQQNWAEAEAQLKAELNID